MNIRKIFNNLTFKFKTPFLDIGLKTNSQIQHTNFSWEYCVGGTIPKNAPAAGCEATGEPLYIARAEFEGGVHIGKIRPGFSGACIPFGGKESIINIYEVFVGECHWERVSNGKLPFGAIAAGREKDGTPLFVARAIYQGGVHIGKYRNEFKGANIPWGGHEVEIESFDILVTR